MNIQSGHTTRVNRQSNRKVQQSFGRHTARLIKVLILVLTVTAAMVVNTNLNQRIAETRSLIAKEQRRKNTITNEIVLKRNRIEELSSMAYICRKIDQYGLKLHFANPGQISKMTLRSNVSCEHRFAAWLRSRESISSMTAAR